MLLVATKTGDRGAEPANAGDIPRRFGPGANGGKGGILLESPFLTVDSAAHEPRYKFYDGHGANPRFV